METESILSKKATLGEKMLRTKRKYKDSLFVDLFARCDEAEENFLSLFNALHGSSFKKGEITVKPLELDNIIYTGLSNDLSMLVGSRLVVLVEHQSTINENMPLRFLEYLAKLYEKILPERSRYSKTVQKNAFSRIASFKTAR